MSKGTNLGQKDNPFITAPRYWHSQGLPYGAWCKCRTCGLIARSTSMFDYYADKGGDELRCETCTVGTSLRSVQPVLDALESEGAFEGYA